MKDEGQMRGLNSIEEGAGGATGAGTAILFPQPHKKGMIFIVRLNIPFYGALKECAGAFIIVLLGKKTMSASDPQRVGVNDKDRAVQGI